MARWLGGVLLGALIAVLFAQAGSAAPLTVKPRAAEALPGVIRVNTFGPDNRRVIWPGTSEDKALSGIGVLKKDGEADATAFLLGRQDLLVTTAHSFYADGRFKRGFYTFAPAGDEVDAVTVREADIVAVGTKSPRFEPWLDWAILKLPEPLPEHYRPLRYWRLSPTMFNNLRNRVQLVAFHQDLIQRFSTVERYVSDGCALQHKRAGDFFVHIEQIYLHDCDFDVVSSGGPLLVHNGSEYVVIAINAGYFMAQPRFGSATSIHYRYYDGRLNPNYAINIDADFANSLAAVFDDPDTELVRAEPDTLSRVRPAAASR